MTKIDFRSSSHLNVFFLDFILLQTATQCIYLLYFIYLYIYLLLSFIVSLVCMTNTFNYFLKLIYSINSLEHSFFSEKSVLINFIVIIILLCLCGVVAAHAACGVLSLRKQARVASI